MSYARTHKLHQTPLAKVDEAVLVPVVLGTGALVMAAGGYAGYRLGGRLSHPWLGTGAGLAVAYIPAWIAALVAAAIVQNKL